tara:strand:- start:213 stop:536 length:324 start_codon:yes stop_codon:yes gene_type:complete
MKKALAIAGLLAFSIIPTPSFSEGLEQKEVMSAIEQLTPQIRRNYRRFRTLDSKEKKVYADVYMNFINDYVKKSPTGISENFFFAEVAACIPRMVDPDMDKYLWCRW